MRNFKWRLNIIMILLFLLLVTEFIKGSFSLYNLKTWFETKVMKFWNIFIFLLILAFESKIEKKNQNIKILICINSYELRQ